MFSHKKDKDKSTSNKDLYLALNTTPAPTPTATPAPTPRPIMETPVRPVTTLTYETFEHAVVTNDLTFVRHNVNATNVNTVFEKHFTTYSLLELAMIHGREDVVKYLLSLKPDLHTKPTPLHIATRIGQVSMMRLLLDAGAQVDARNKSLETPLHKAIEQRHEEAVALLLARGANVDARNHWSETPVSMLVNHSIHDGPRINPRNNENTIVRIFKMLVAKDVNIDSEYPDENGNFHSLRLNALNQRRVELLEIIDAVDKKKREKSELLIQKIDDLQRELKDVKKEVRQLKREKHQDEKSSARPGYNPFN